MSLDCRPLPCIHFDMHLVFPERLMKAGSSLTCLPYSLHTEGLAVAPRIYFPVLAVYWSSGSTQGKKHMTTCLRGPVHTFMMIEVRGHLTIPTTRPPLQNPHPLGSVSTFFYNQNCGGHPRIFKHIRYNVYHGGPVHTRCLVWFLLHYYGQNWEGPM